VITLSVQEGRRRNPEPPLYDEDVPIGIYHGMTFPGLAFICGIIAARAAGLCGLDALVVDNYSGQAGLIA
tara:strand:+ start:259 stop:468 length:210 start_codon:yes stop_codon:yes gene_type:complete